MIRYLITAPAIVLDIAWLQPAPEPMQTVAAVTVLGRCENLNSDRSIEGNAYKAPCAQAVWMLHGSCKLYAQALEIADGDAGRYFSACLPSVPATIPAT